MKPPSPFIAIVDKNGEVWETIPRTASMQNITSAVDAANRNRKWSAPHEAWLWNGAVWYHFKTH
jgi:hypothetical protein